MPELLKPDMKAVVWLLLGYLVLGKAVDFARTKLGK